MAQANVTIGVKNGVFKKGLDEMRSQAKDWGNDIKGTIAGAFALGAVTSFVSGFMSEMARVKDIADRLGVSSDVIQRVGNAAKLSGSDLEYVIKTLTKMTLAATASAEKFEAVGISAAEFASSDIEGQILMLAEAYDEANTSQEKMLQLMNLLGPKGQDMLILLSQGAGALEDQMKKVPIVAAQAVQAMAILDDSIDSFAQHSKSSLGAVLGLLAHLGAATSAAAQMMYKGGSFSDNYNKNIQGMLDQNPTGGGWAQDYNGPVDKEEEKKKDKEAKEAAKASKNLDDEMLKLARSRMNAEQKITDLKREQAKYAAEARDKSKSDADRANAAIKVLQIQQDIESGQAEIAKEKKKLEDDAAKDADKKAKDAAKAEADLAEEERSQKLEKMSPDERIKELKKQQKELNDAASKEADPKTKAEKKLEALKLNDDIDAAMKEKDNKLNKSNPSVISSSLASVGGGGGAYVGTDPALTEARRTNNLLASIDRKLGQGGSSFSQPRNPF